MAGIPLNFGGSNDSHCSEVGLFLKFANLPPNDTCLVDIKGGTPGSFRLTLQPGGIIIAEYGFLGIHTQCFLTNPTLLDPGSWYWMTALFGSDNSVSGCFIRGQVWGPSGTTDGQQLSAAGSSGPASQLLSCDVGWGVHLTSAFDDFPNASGWEMASFYIKTWAPRGGGVNTGAALQAPPITDLSPSGMTALYLCHQPLGPITSTITDSSGNGYHLTPGGNGARIVADGPY